jgi:hypothetical protein
MQEPLTGYLAGGELGGGWRVFVREDVKGVDYIDFNNHVRIIGVRGKWGIHIGENLGTLGSAILETSSLPKSFHM